MGQLALIDAYEKFMETAHNYVNLSSDEEYNQALAALEDILEAASDTKDDPLNPLIELLSQAIETCESQDSELMAFMDVRNKLKGLEKPA